MTPERRDGGQGAASGIGLRSIHVAEVIAHPPAVKGFKHHDGYGVGMRLVYTWLDR